MAAVGPADLVGIERRVALRMIEVFGLDTSAVALDMTDPGGPTVATWVCPAPRSG
jgi:hypothetical protein